MIRLTLKDAPPVRLSAKALLPERLRGLSVGEIERLPLVVGRSQGAVGDWFRVAPAGDGAIEVDGPCARLDHIGVGMSEGVINVRGDAGAYLGLGMRGGSITVDGSVGFGAACDLRGGSLRIAGDAGDGLGGALPGASGGMRDGIVIVAGNAGEVAGARLRRGLVVVAGSAGAGCGAEMIAGTIVVGGSVGAYCGAAMRRGSVVVLGRAERIGIGFVDCGVHDLVFLRLLARDLGALGLAALARRIGALRRLVGDAAVMGRGELFIVP